ncbi:AraC family transcriptional regulator [bacterium]|nr:AraC family transcriptional regulator [bacterium]
MPVSPDTNREYERRLNRVLEHLWYHPDDENNLEKLAEIACFSRFHFHRIFHSLVGEPVGVYVRQLRLRQAAYRLVYNSSSVTEIALDAGFDSPAAFSRAFSRQFGESPSRFRKRGKALTEQYRQPPRVSLEQQVKQPMQGVELVTLEPMTVAYVRSEQGYLQEGVSAAFERLMEFSYAQNKLPSGEPLFIGISWDDSQIISPGECRFEAAVMVHPDAQPAGGVGVRRLTGGLFARYRHFGSYSGLSNTYARLIREWLVDPPYLMRNEPTREYYRNNPDSTPPEDLLTEIHLPIKRL